VAARAKPQQTASVNHGDRALPTVTQRRNDWKPDGAFSFGGVKASMLCSAARRPGASHPRMVRWSWKTSSRGADEQSATDASASAAQTPFPRRLQRSTPLELSPGPLTPPPGVVGHRADCRAKPRFRARWVCQTIPPQMHTRPHRQTVGTTCVDTHHARSPIKPVSAGFPPLCEEPGRLAGSDRFLTQSDSEQPGGKRDALR
jgi:hypothetical protein